MIVLFPLVGFWLWVVWIASACWLCSAVYSDRYFQATVDLVVLVALLSVTGNIHVVDCWQYVLHNPGSILGFVAAYLGIGVVWSLIKWKLLLRHLKGKLLEYGYDAKKREELAANPRHKEAPYELSILGLNLVDGKIQLHVDNFKSKIVGWMTYWWVSMPVWVVGDALHELFETLYLSVRRFYQQMADSALNND